VAGVTRAASRWRLRTATLVAAVAAVAACAVPTVQLEEGPREYVATDYARVLDKWTREMELLNVDELDNVLTVTATYESWDFRWAYVTRYAEDYRLTVDQRRALLERSLAETRKHHQFYVALYAQRPKWSDLTVDKPAWIVRLIDDLGSETAPIAIEAIKRPGAIEHTYFPYTTPWRSAYRIRFPTARADGQPTVSTVAEWFGLRFTGAQGNDKLVWQIDRSGLD
jgi:hypothetical protein